MTLSTICLAATMCLLGQTSPLDELDLPDRPRELGAFARLLSTEDFVGPGLLPVPQQPGETPSRNEGPRLPADFDAQEHLVLVADKLVRRFPRELVEIVKATHDRVRLIGLVSDSQGRNRVLALLAENGLAADSIRLIRVPSDTIWVRDFGPVFVRLAGRGLFAFDLDYARRSGDHGRRRDDSAATALAGQLDVSVRRVPLEVEQGDVLCNGDDLLVTTTRLFNNNIARGFSAQTVERSLRTMFGCNTVVVLEPLRRERTGHVDVFACFTAPDTMVVGSYQESADREDARVLERNAALLASVRVAGKPLRIVRLTMPHNDDDLWRTYTNVVFANGTLLLPQYEGADSAADVSATETFRRLLPEWKIVGIDATRLVAQEGALRCVTLNVPVVHVNDGEGQAAADRLRGPVAGEGRR